MNYVGIDRHRQYSQMNKRRQENQGRDDDLRALALRTPGRVPCAVECHSREFRGRADPPHVHRLNAEPTIST